MTKFLLGLGYVTLSWTFAVVTCYIFEVRFEEAKWFWGPTAMFFGAGAFGAAIFGIFLILSYFDNGDLS